MEKRWDKNHNGRQKQRIKWWNEEVKQEKITLKRYIGTRSEKDREEYKSENKAKKAIEEVKRSWKDFG